MNILCIESFSPHKTHNRTLLFTLHSSSTVAILTTETSLGTCACASATQTVMKVYCTAYWLTLPCIFISYCIYGTRSIITKLVKHSTFSRLLFSDGAPCSSVTYLRIGRFIITAIRTSYPTGDLIGKKNIQYLIRMHHIPHCHAVGSDCRRGLDWWIDLLTTYRS
jgi:hypothetical protein